MSVLTKTILIADDEEDVRMLVQVTLEDPCYHIVTAVDGEEALQRIREHPPDLLILDWMMPKLTGLEVVENLQDHPITKRIPVILLTSMGRQEDKDRAHQYGLFAYLIKPFSPLELLQTVKDALR